MGKIDNAIYWWENELSGDERTKFLKGKLWKGTVEERHKRLLNFYRKRKGV